MLNRSARTGLVVAAVVLAACGDSTAPRPVTAAQLARHIDSLAKVALTTGTSGARFYFLSNAEVAPANGASPVSMTVTTRSGDETWQGFVVKLVDTVGGLTGVDSTYILFAYRDYGMTTILFAQTPYIGTLAIQPEIYVMSDTTVASNDSDATGTNTFETNAGSSACTLVSGLHEYLFSPGTDCNLATFQASLSWTLGTATGAMAEFGTVTVAPQQYNGAILRF